MSKPVAVTITGTVTAKGGSATYTADASVSAEPTSVSSQGKTVNITFDSKGLGYQPTYRIQMNATSYPGMNKASISGACNPKNVTVTGLGQVARIYVTGKTLFIASGGGGGPNTAMAYILAETDNNVGPPSGSYVQYAFWAAQGGGGGGGSSSISEEIFNNPGDYEDENGDVVSNTSSHGNASSLYKEACDFASVANAAQAFYTGGGVSLSVGDTVEFDGDTNIYTVGPFLVTYLESYTGSAQLAGMFGVPKLTVKINDGTGPTREETWPCGSNWEFYYKGGRVTAGIPDEYQVYPHSGETFYINLKYMEGMERIVRTKFSV